MPQNKTPFDQLRVLLFSLSKHEHIVLKKYLGCFKKGGANKSKPKTTLLYELMLSKRNFSESGISSRVGAKNKNAFLMVVLRLQKKVLDSLILDTNIYHPNSYSNRARNLIDCPKLLAAGVMMHSRGHTELALQIYESVIKKSKKYEVYDCLIEALFRKSYIIGYENGEELLSKIEVERAYYKACKDLLEEAQVLHRNLVVKHRFNALPQNHLIKELTNSVQHLEGLNEEYNSDLVLYYTTLIAAYSNELQEKFEENISLYLNLHDRARDSHCLNSDVSLGIIYLNLAYYQSLLNLHEDTILNANLAAEYFEPGTNNYLLARDYLFDAYFSKEEFATARDMMKQAIGMTNVGAKRAIRTYKLACAYFYLGDHRQVHNHLQIDTKKLDGDKTGWNVANRILTIMNQIQWGGLHKPSAVFVENLAVHTKKYQDMFPRSANRFLAIIKVLKSLEKASFDFDKCYANEKEIIDMLSEDNGELAWSKLSPELVRFDHWFHSKKIRTKMQN